MNNERRQITEETKTVIWKELCALIVRILKKLFGRIGDEADCIIDGWSFNPA